ncbi:glycosyl hydrolase family 28-related protein [Tunturiibacter gelidoferens]|uniref:Glycosyl hydrolase family 28-related protein n=1 Tax=Tunturiibacter gelidiferens TaxID=3069689 RepID=A0AAU7Z0S9_9BACT
MNVKTAFGAKGDGVTDDTEAFQNALNQLVSNPAILWVPKGTYIISATLQMTACGGVSIIGEDPKQSVIQWNGPAGGTMLDLEGCAWFRLARLGWNGEDRASVVMRIDSTLENGENYPTYDDIEDQQISHTGIGIQVGFAGETSVQRVHFDHNTIAGVLLASWNALNFNVVDSLFTDCNVGVTNSGPGGSGAFNVSNSVFVRSQTTDMMMWNTGPFSERQNISFDSTAFFIGGQIGAGATIVLQGNTVISPATTPIQIGNPGPIMLIDNYFAGLDPSLNILSVTGANPLGVFSIGNVFAVASPFGSNIGLFNSVDEAQSSSDIVPEVNIPTDVYIPPLSGRPIFEVPVGSSASAIQKLVDSAALESQGGVVHFPEGTFWIDHTINVRDSTNLTLTGDGPLTSISGVGSLSGPVIQISGTHARLENMALNAEEGSATDTALEIDIEDRPSTSVHCDQCKTNYASVGLQVGGVDNALVDVRIGELNAAAGQRAAVITGGAVRQGGGQTLGRLDGFMMSLDSYEVSDGGHFLVEDSWHDVGQGSQQFTLSGPGVVTHEGGTVYTPSSAPSMKASQFSGSVSLLGVSSNSILSMDQSQKASAMIAGTVQISGLPMLATDGSVTHTTQLSNFQSVNNLTPTPVLDVPSSSTVVEKMFAQARTEYVVPRLTPSPDVTEIDLHRIVVSTDGIGIKIQPKSSFSGSNSYSITSLASNGQSTGSPSSCSNGSLTMNGAWTLQQNVDGFYGLSNGSTFLSNRTSDSTDSTSTGVSATMSDAGQRWNIRPVGGGSFHVINRANGMALTSDSKGCISLSVESEASSQEWSVDLIEPK